MCFYINEKLFCFSFFFSGLIFEIYEYCNVNNEVLLEYEVVNIDIRSYF